MKFHPKNKWGPKVVDLLIADGPMTQAEIRKRIDLDPGNTSYVIRNLEEAGWIAPTGRFRARSKEYRVARFPR